MIYWDNAATAKPDQRAVERAAEFLTNSYFNPSASYGGGFAVRTEIKNARDSLISRVADATKFELIFTSGGTEGDNQAVFGGARRGNAVTTAGEHAAVYESFKELKNRGVEPRFASVNRDGSVDVNALLSLVDEKTSLVSVMHVNNETGAINPIADIAKAVKKKNPRALFHSDGVQAFGKLAFRLTAEIDLYTVSAHKIGGLKSTGALIKRKGLVLPPLLFGGGQESALRSGTENVHGIMAFSCAAEEKFSTLSADYARIEKYRETLFSLLDKKYFTRISPENGSPYILTVSVEGARGEVLQRMLFDKGLAVGTGSACNSKHRFSRVIAACGYPERVLDGVLRISFSSETKEEEIEAGVALLNAVAKEFKDKV